MDQFHRHMPPTTRSSPRGRKQTSSPSKRRRTGLIESDDASPLVAASSPSASSPSEPKRGPGRPPTRRNWEQSHGIEPSSNPERRPKKLRKDDADADAAAEAAAEAAAAKAAAIAARSDSTAMDKFVGPHWFAKSVIKDPAALEQELNAQRAHFVDPLSSTTSASRVFDSTAPAAASSSSSSSGSTVSDDHESLRPVFLAASAALQSSVSPHVLVGREKECSELEGVISRAISQGVGCSTLVSGLPGTGKTACVRLTLSRLASASQEGGAKMPSFRVIEVNGMQATIRKHIYRQIATSLEDLWNGQHVQPLSALRLFFHANQDPPANASSGNVQEGGDADDEFRDDADDFEADLPPFDARQANAISKRISSDRPYIVLVLEELDQLITRDHKLLYNLLDWPRRAGSRLAIIGISNALDLPQRLAPKILSRLGKDRISFPPYTSIQLQSILHSRLEGLSAFDQEALEGLCRRVASFSGDARRALEICRQAVEHALNVDSRTPITVSDLDNIAARIFRSHATAFVSLLPLHQQALLVAVAHALRSAEAGKRSSLPIPSKYRRSLKARHIQKDMDEATTHWLSLGAHYPTVIERYRALMNSLNCSPLPPAGIRLAVSRLEALGLLAIVTPVWQVSAAATSAAIASAAVATAASRGRAPAAASATSSATPSGASSSSSSSAAAQPPARSQPSASKQPDTIDLFPVIRHTVGVTALKRGAPPIAGSLQLSIDPDVLIACLDPSKPLRALATAFVVPPNVI